MSKESILGVDFTSVDNNPVIDSDNSSYYIPFNKTDEYFDVYENRVIFIKGCEALVRKHKFYKQYINYLINVVGMNTCQVLPNIDIDPNSKVVVEMHHGPILTLFDTCEIVLNHLLAHHDTHITTFSVANKVIEEHRLNNVRVMMVTKTVHQKIHDDSIMLNYNMGFGDTAEFLRKYSDGVDKSMRRKINAYIEWSKSNDSFDNAVLEIAENMTKYENDFDEFEDTLNEVAIV